MPLSESDIQPPSDAAGYAGTTADALDTACADTVVGEERVASQTVVSIPTQPLPIRLLLATDARAFGGAEQYLTRIAETAICNDVPVAVATPDTEALSDWRTQLRALGAMVLPTLQQSTLADHIRQPDGQGRQLLFHYNGSWVGSFLPLARMVRRYGGKVVVTEHSLRSAWDRGSGIRRFAPWRVQRYMQELRRRHEWSLAESVLTVSNLQRQMLCDQVGLPDRSGVLYNGVDTDHYRPDSQARGQARSQLAVDDDVCLIGSVGRLDWNKGYDVVLHALATLHSPHVQVLLVGDGAERATLAALSDSLGLTSRVHFAGYRRDIPACLNAMDVFVLPSRSEALPFSVIEAASTGLPVIASDVGGVREVVRDGRTGYILPADNVQMLRDRLRSLAASESTRRRMGQAGRRLAVEQFDQRVMLGRIWTLYADLCRNR